MKNIAGLLLIAFSIGGCVAFSASPPGVYVLLALFGAAGLLSLLIQETRWLICALLFLAITISYMDRQTLSLAINEIGKSGDVKLSDGDFATLNTCFLLAYALMYVGGGKLMDLLGIRWGFFSIMVFWSLAVVSHGFAASFLGLAMCRILLGVGEGGGFPAVTKAIGEWFPAKERSTAIGIANSGTALGGMIAPPLVAMIIGYQQWPDLGRELNDAWRWVFFLFGTSGLVWCAGWILWYRPQTQDTAVVNKSTSDNLPPLETAIAEQEIQTAVPWLKLLTLRHVWGLMLCKALGDGVWYFITFWMPKYLMDVRGFDIKAVGNFAWLPWVGAGLGSILMGYLSSRLIYAGLTINASRKIALGLSVSLMPILYFVPQTTSSHYVIAIFFIAYFGQQAWSTLVMTLPTDLFPPGNVGAVAGLVGFGGAMGGILFGQIAGRYLDAHPLDYEPIFGVASILHILSFVLVMCLIPQVSPSKQ